MLGLEYWLPSHASSATYLLLLWAAGAIAVLVVVLGALAFRDEGMRGTLTVLLRGAAVLVFAALAWAWLDLFLARERAAERRALEARAAELAARSLAPNSALACLDGVGNEAVEAACANAVFASPQAVAAAVAYADARLQLLADGLEYAKRDKAFAGELARLRQGLEADRFGVVAQALARRGCNAERCPEFSLFGDPSKIQANLKDGAFEAQLARYLPRWQPDDPTPAADAGQPNTPPVAAASPETQNAVPGTKYSFPSAASIPPISIMNAEPTGSAPGASGPAAGPPAPEAQNPAARTQPNGAVPSPAPEKPAARARSGATAPPPSPEAQKSPPRAQSSSRPPTAQRRPPPPQALGPEN
jgi:hypothetical protein